MEGGRNRLLPVEAVPLFQEGIGLVVSRWSALQLVLENEWGCRDSRRKVELLCSDVFTWFTHNNEPLDVYDLEVILDEAMNLMSADFDDGSIEEVAKKLMAMHEECLDGNFSSIERLRQNPLPRVAHFDVGQAMNDEEEEEDDDGVDVGNGRDAMNNDMMVDDIQQPKHVNQPNQVATVEAEDGWVKSHQEEVEVQEINPFGTSPLNFVWYESIHKVLEFSLCLEKIIKGYYYDIVW